MQEPYSQTFSMHRSTQAIGLAFLLSFLSKNETEVILKKVITTTYKFHSIYIQENCPLIIAFRPHLESLLKKIEGIKEKNNIKEEHLSKLFLMLGNIYYQCIGDLELAKLYFTKIYKCQNLKIHLSKLDYAMMLKNLAIIDIDLSHLDESIKYAKESIKYCTNIMSDFRVLNIVNLITIGSAYVSKNDIDNSLKFLFLSLESSLKLDHPLKHELSSISYATIAFSYASIYLGKYKKEEVEKYAKKSLEVLNTYYLSSKALPLLNLRLACQIIRSKIWLGRSYSILGKYKEALELGFKEAENIMDTLSINDCPHNLILPYNAAILKIYILCGKGEFFLREGYLKEAENLLEQAASIEDAYLRGTFRKFVIRPLRIEARIRLRNFEEAYKDCNNILKEKLERENNYFNLAHLTCFYHAAVIKYKQKNYIKSTEHFADFFKKMKDFCKGLLEEKEYKALEAAGVFKEIELSKPPTKEDMKQYLSRSIQIFSAIYGYEHPFVKDYVRKN